MPSAAPCASLLASQVAIKAPSFGERRKNYLQDIAIATGSTYVAEEVGLTLDQVGHTACHLACLSYLVDLVACHVKTHSTVYLCCDTCSCGTCDEVA